MTPETGNLFAHIPERFADEQFRELLAAPDLCIERIVSTGQATPPGEWLDQSQAEWVILLSGAASLRFEGEASARDLKPGDYVTIPAHCRHRVDWTAVGEPTVWLAVHYVP